LVEITIYPLFLKSAARDGAGAKPEKIGAADVCTSQTKRPQHQLSRVQGKLVWFEKLRDFAKR
jgi:hypothetical protein